MNLSKTFLYFNSFLIILIPPFLISGPFLPDAVCSYIGLFYLIYFIKVKDFSVYKNYFFGFFFLIYLYLNFNSLLSFNSEISFQTSLVYFRVILFICAISYLLKNYKSLKFYFYISCLICLILLMIGSVLDINKAISKDLSYVRVTSLFGTEQILGSYVVRILPLIIGLSYMIKIPQRESINLATLLIAGLLVILSGERTASVYFFFLVIFYFFINRKQILLFILLFSTITFILYNYNNNSFNRIYTHTISQQKNSGHLLSFRHEAHLLTAYNMFLEKKLFGHGLKSFRNLCDRDQYNIQLNDRKYINDVKYNFYKRNPLTPLSKDISEVTNGCSTHPHNIYFQFLSEIGLIGFLLFFGFFLFICIKLLIFFKDFLYNKMQCSNSYIASNFFLFGIFTAMFPMIPSGNYFNNWLLIISTLPLGFYLSLAQNK
jgi:O-antigen ligase